ncbi:S-adenosyl-L-methionine-dependent methyltransferase [Basidiobolus meristosporus CBS 931.73]|uniref:S-adenosyl-L-methionine-dependent methyltransferase n=1 Tax=Basidiobolus meristosporus CBS 931.73 TaxID=1314790 RepID=A0A1Y1Y979_9FUNG|nr:S-adenosyl-L-methionine-dependent methyltransferase [Basidiobolus meristosporus CBS 931.73]|eukprot:ORX94569.1 S-adenosyl-L-methionine-dependent methyltransferase [Basidiobolus meristosporus CBS 931.73]
MRALAGFGIFDESFSGGAMIYSNNRHSRLLVSSNPKTLKYYVLHRGNESYAASVDLDKMFIIENKGKIAFNSYYKTDKKYWEWLEEVENKEILDIFGNAMVSISSWKGRIVAGEFNWSQFRHKHLVDVGGGFGGVLKAILEENPQIRATIFDREAVITLSRQEWALRNHHISDNVTFTGGDFFKSVPNDGDVYLLCTVLHDWDDPSCIKILKTIRKHMTKPHARLLILEMIVTSPMPDPVVAYSDLQMMMMVDGKERSPKEFAYLLQKSGFLLHQIHTLSKGYALIEGRLP